MFLHRFKNDRFWWRYKSIWCDLRTHFDWAYKKQPTVFVHLQKMKCKWHDRGRSESSGDQVFDWWPLDLFIFIWRWGRGTCFLHIQGPSGILATHLWGEENPLAPVLWCLACVCECVCPCTPVKTAVFVWNPCVWGCVFWCTRDCFIPPVCAEGNVISVRQSGKNISVTSTFISTHRILTWLTSFVDQLMACPTFGCLCI